MPKDASNDNVSAARKLELSRIDKRAIARGGMATDTDVEHFSLYVSSKLKTDVVGRIVDASIERTIEGASTLSVTILDEDRAVLNSGMLNSKLDVQIDGLWFRLASVDKSDDDLTITFEDREIAVLREYAKWKIARRANVTRAEFIMNLIREVREFKIPVVIPELHKVQPIEKYSGDIIGSDPYSSYAGGVPDSAANAVATDTGTGGSNTAASPTVPNQALTPGEQRRANTNKILTVKGTQINPTQVSNANTIIGVGKGMLKKENNPQKLIVCAIMTGITESSLTAIADKAHGGNSDDASAGVFQQIPGWGSYEDRMDVATSARMFYQHAIKYNAAHPDVGYGELCQGVQISAYPDRYALYRTEADRIVYAAGNVAGIADANLQTVNQTNTPTGANYAFWRGKIEDRHGIKIKKPENTWSCIQRLAGDVNWRAFFVAGTFYYISEEDLFKQKPIAVVHEFMPGIRAMNGNYDRNKKSGTITISAVIGKWEAAPGSIIVVRDMGVWNGRWIVNDFRRSLFDDVAEITLKKPLPALPEPLQDDSTQVQDSWYDQPATLDKGIIPTKSKDIIQAVQKNKNITYSGNTVSQQNDIASGVIDDRVLQFLLYAANNGWPCEISALKSDHSKYTSEGNLSAHGAGRAVDIRNYNESNPRTDAFMDWVKLGQSVTGFDQLIGPNSLKVIPPGYYDAKTLGEHKSHCHIGWAM